MQPDYRPLDRAIEKASKELDLDIRIVEKVYRAYCRLIVKKLSSLPLKEDLTDEEFNKLQTSVNLPSLGKISCTLDRYKRLKQKQIYVQKGKENKAAKHRHFSNNEPL